jgi:hypothetical protein
MCLSFKSEKKDVFGILSDTVLLIVLVTSNMIYLKLPIDNKSITIEQVMLLISYTAWIILEYFEILKLTKMDSDKKIEKIITFVYIIILVMSIMRMA